ncbi:MAG: NUDIX domain-containing protein [Candidatus Omnitrophica bacterium]|nr:NUDIX domain-containing protein [Candidatus Omnitrophota bacterium]
MKKELDVVAALIIKDDKFLVCQREENDSYGLLWEFPGGCIELNETFQEAIEREIKEELDLEIKAVSLIKTFFDENENLKIKIFLWSCKTNQGIPKTKQCNDFGFFNIKEISSLNLAPADQKIFNYLKSIF